MNRETVNNAGLSRLSTGSVQIAFFAALLIILSKIVIPLPFTPVPFTLQLIGVFLIGLLLPPFEAALAIAVYLFLGALGLPVFAKGGGLAYILGPTGGFLYGFLIASPVVSLIYRKFRGFVGALVSCLAGLIIIYFFGALHLWQVSGKGFAFVLTAAVIPFVPFDIIKAIIAASVASAAKRL
jgi:biotin transport system substrate-specific component